MKSLLSVIWLAVLGLFLTACDDPVKEDLTPSFDLMEYFGFTAFG